MVGKIQISPLLVKFFALPLLREWGLSARLSTRNKWNSTMRVKLSVFSEGVPIFRGQDMGRDLLPGEMLSIGATEILSFAAELQGAVLPSTAGFLALIHLVPADWDAEGDAGMAKQEFPLGIARDYAYRTDAYASYEEGGQEKMTVGYHCLWWNMQGAPPASTVFQGCKFPNFSEQETFLLLLNFAADWNWTTALSGKIMLTNSAGLNVSESDFAVPAFSYRLVRIGAEVDALSSASYLNIIGFCQTGQILPFFVSRNLKLGSYFIEHGVGPDGYYFGVNAAQKKRSADFLATRIWSRPSSAGAATA